MKNFSSLREDLRKWFNPKAPEGGWKRINSKGEAIGPCAREPSEPKPKCMSNEKRAQLTKKERASAVASKRRNDPDPERKGAPINVSNFGKGKISEACWVGYTKKGMKKKGDRMVPNCVPEETEIEEANAAAIAAATAIAKKKSGNYDSEGFRTKPYKNPDAPNIKTNAKRKKEMEEDYLEEKNVPTSPEKWAQAKAQAKSKFDVYPSAYANGWASKKYKEMGGGWKSVSEDASPVMAQMSKRLTNPKDGAIAKLRAAGDKRREEHLKGRNIAKRYVSEVKEIGDDPTGDTPPENLKRKGSKLVVELTNTLLSRYKKAAGTAASAADKSGNFGKANKRFKGIVKATIKQGNNDMKNYIKEELEKYLLNNLRIVSEDVPPIHVRSLYAQTYAKHGKIVSQSNAAKELAYRAVEKKHGPEMRKKLSDYHTKNQNESVEMNEAIEAVLTTCDQCGNTECTCPHYEGRTGKLKNESVESIDESDSMKSASKEMHDYASSHGGTDKTDYHTAAKHMAANDHKAIHNHLKKLDTEPRDQILITLHKHGNNIKRYGYTTEEVESPRKMYHKHFVKAMKAMPGSQVQKGHHLEMEKYKKMMGKSFIDQVAPKEFAKFDRSRPTLRLMKGWSKAGKIEEVVTESREILTRGTPVMVPHKGKMKAGKIVRYDQGRGGPLGLVYSPAYVVDVGEYASIKVLPSEIKQEMMGNITKKKMVTDRKTGKEYDPNAEMDKLLNKHKSQLQGMAAIEKAQKKKMVTDRKTGKEYDPNAEMDKLLNKHKSQLQGMAAIEKAQKKGMTESEIKVGDMVSFDHEMKSIPGKIQKKSGTVAKLENNIAHVKVKDKYGVITHKKNSSDLRKEEVELDEAIPKSTIYAVLHSSSKKIIDKGNKKEMMKKTKELNTKEKGSHFLGMTIGKKIGDTFGEEVESIDEGRPSQRHPLEGHEYHKKTNAELEHIAKDAHKAAEAMKSHNTTAENKYRDQANDSATVRHFRKTSGTPNWYKKKYGHVNEAAVVIKTNKPIGSRVADIGPGGKEHNVTTNTHNDVPFDGPYKKVTGPVTDKSGAKHTAMSRVRHLASTEMKRQAEMKKKKLGEASNQDVTTDDNLTISKPKISNKARIVKNAAKKKTDTFQAQPELSSTITKNY